MAKKLLVKDLKRDEIAADLIHAGEEAIHWTERHRGPLLGGVAALVLIAAALGGHRWWSSSRENASEAKLAEAMRLMDEVERAAAAPGDETAATTATWDQVATVLKEAVDAGPGSPGSRLARLHLGHVQVKQGKPAEAVATLESLAKDAPSAWLAPHALAALAIAQEQAGDAAAAHATLEKLEAGKWTSWPPSASIMLLAELEQRQGNVEAAKERFRKLAEAPEHADSPYAAAARQALEGLGG